MINLNIIKISMLLLLLSACSSISRDVIEYPQYESYEEFTGNTIYFPSEAAYLEYKAENEQK